MVIYRLRAGDGVENSTEKYYNYNIIMHVYITVSKRVSGKQKEGVAAMTPSAHIHRVTLTAKRGRSCYDSKCSHS